MTYVCITVLWSHSILNLESHWHINKDISVHICSNHSSSSLTLGRNYGQPPHQKKAMQPTYNCSTTLLLPLWNTLLPPWTELCCCWLCEAHHRNKDSEGWCEVTPLTDKQLRLSQFSSTFLGATEILAVPQGFNVNIQREMGGGYFTFKPSISATRLVW